MREEITEESKARKFAEKAARQAEKATTPEEQSSRGPVRQAAEQHGPPSTSQIRSLSTAINSMEDFSEANKVLIKSCLENEEFDLKSAKQIKAAEFKQLFSKVPFPHWKKLETHLSKF
jgi:hypothetical protein